MTQERRKLMPHLTWCQVFWKLFVWCCCKEHRDTDIYTILGMFQGFSIMAIDSCLCLPLQGSLALPQHPPAAPPAPHAICPGSPGRRLGRAAVSAAAGPEQRLSSRLPPSERSPLSSPQQLDGGGRPLRLWSALGSAQTAANSGRSSVPPSPPQLLQEQLCPLLHPLGPHLWHIPHMNVAFTFSVTTLWRATIRMDSHCQHELKVVSTKTACSAFHTHIEGWKHIDWRHCKGDVFEVQNMLIFPFRFLLWGSTRAALHRLRFRRASSRKRQSCPGSP